MSYKNSPIPENTNISEGNIFKQLLLLTLGVVVILALALLVIMKLASWGAGSIPFRYEVMLADQLHIGDMVSSAQVPADPDAYDQAVNYLQSLADKVARVQELPEMPITVHLVLDDTVNAFATLGGHLFLHQGLLEKLESENALVMLISHEIAHVAHRDPLRAASGALTAGLAVEWLTGGSGLGAAIIGDQAIRLLASGFSREQELQADQFGREALERIYGHFAGGGELFQVLLDESVDMPGLLGFWSSHPDTQARLEMMPRLVGDITPLKFHFSTLKTQSLGNQFEGQLEVRDRY